MPPWRSRLPACVPSGPAAGEGTSRHLRRARIHELRFGTPHSSTRSPVTCAPGRANPRGATLSRPATRSRRSWVGALRPRPACRAGSVSAPGATRRRALCAASRRRRNADIRSGARPAASACISTTIPDASATRSHRGIPRRLALPPSPAPRARRARARIGRGRTDATRGRPGALALATPQTRQPVSEAA